MFKTEYNHSHMIYAMHMASLQADFSW